MSHIVVIGAGQAGASLVAKLRSDGFEGDITLLGAEENPPYQRPALSKAYLLGEMEKGRLFLRPRDWYETNNITLRTQTRAVDVDCDAQTVTLADGETLHYDHLAFATGSHPIQLPSECGGKLDGVYTVRDLKDADSMAPEFVAGRRAVIIGGGYIGLEAAAVAAKRGVNVTIIEMSDRILQRVAAPETSDYFRELHRKNGVDVREGVKLVRFLGDERITGALLSDGTTLDADFAIVGIGIYPATILAESAGVDCKDGILTNSRGQTSIANVWAAGDCATSTLKGRKIRLESVGNAIDQAEVVAQNMMGADKNYEPKPWFWSDQYDCKLQIAGLICDYTDVVQRKTDACQSHWYFDGDELIAVDAMNDPRNYMVGKRLIDAGKSPSKAAVEDPDTDMKALLRT